MQSPILVFIVPTQKISFYHNILQDADWLAVSGMER